MRQERKVALLALEDGSLFWGNSIGSAGETFGELVFNTSMSGYQEVLTDPSYFGQIVVMTYPEIGIYGVNAADVESDAVQVAGYVVHRAVHIPFNQKATLAFPEYLRQAGVVALDGIDTRALTRHLRTHGAMRGGIAVAEDRAGLDPEALVARVRQTPTISGRDLAQHVTSRGFSPRDRAGERPHIVLVDAGHKNGMLRNLSACGAAVTVVPYDAQPAAVLALDPDGVLISNGPGDPEPLASAVVLIRALLKARVPVAGICLGHQLLGLALGGRTYKMQFGHRGVNHPVKDLESGSILITSQNHGFGVDPTSLGIAWMPLDAAFEPADPTVSLPDVASTSTTMAEQLPSAPLVGVSPEGFGAVEVTHLSLNDGTVEGLKLRDCPAFSVQFHPEASPGPHDARGFFSQFLALVTAHTASGSSSAKGIDHA